MAKFGPWKNAFVEINGVDLSNHVESVTINHSVAALDNSAMGDETDIQVAGLFQWSVDINFYQDFASGSVDRTLYPLYSGRSIHTIKIRSENAAASATNPQWRGLGFITSYPMMGGAHGDNLMVPVSWGPSGDMVKEIA